MQTDGALIGTKTQNHKGGNYVQKISSVNVVHVGNFGVHF